MTMDQIVGLNIKKRRKILNMSQDDLSKLTGLSLSALYLIENGKKSLTIKNLVKIKNALRVSYNYFFVEVESSSAGSVANS